MKHHFNFLAASVFRGVHAQRQQARYKPKSVTDCARSARVAGLALSGYIQSETLLLAWLIQGVTR